MTGQYFFEMGAREVCNQFLGDMNFIPHLEVVHDFWWAIACAIIFFDIKSQNNFIFLLTLFCEAHLVWNVRYILNYYYVFWKLLTLPPICERAGKLN